jgi:acetyltransferase-like isoleucine patch superfamily enzyme
MIYNKEVFKSKYFKGKLCGIAGTGWRWVMDDIHGRIFLRTNKGVPFPISPYNTVINPKNIVFDPDDLHIFNGKGRFFQAENAMIMIGSGCYIANNVGLVSSNHDIMDPSKNGKSGDIVLGEKCWIGMNSVIMSGVHLGDHTIVGAGSVVTKSFPEGHCVIAGTPAKIIRTFTAEEAVREEDINE